MAESDGQIPSGTSRTWTFATDDDYPVWISSNGSITVQVDPDATKVTVEVNAPAFPEPTFQTAEGERHLAIGDPMTIFAAPGDLGVPPRVRVTIPASATARFPVALMTKGSLVNLIGHPDEPMHIGDLNAFGSKVLGRHLKLGPGDVQTTGDQARGAGLFFSSVDLGGAPRTIQVHRGAELRLDCAEPGALTVQHDGASQDISITGTPWHRHDRASGTTVEMPLEPAPKPSFTPFAR